MPPATIPLSGYVYRPSLRSRLTALVLSCAILVLIVLTMVLMGRYYRTPVATATRLTAIDMPAGTKAEPKAAAKAAAAARQPITPQPQPVTPPVPVLKPTPLKLILMSHADFASSDISKMSHQGNQSGNSASSYGPGEGPGGAQLFNAEWYREPGHAALAGYIKHEVPPGAWAMIACKTIEDYHVENCQQLGESPEGSGLSRALREAAWQFLVRPPRINGKAQIGAWVRIRFDFTRAKRGEDAPDDSAAAAQ